MCPREDGAGRGGVAIRDEERGSGKKTARLETATGREVILLTQVRTLQADTHTGCLQLYLLLTSSMREQQAVTVRDLLQGSNKTRFSVSQLRVNKRGSRAFVAPPSFIEAKTAV